MCVSPLPSFPWQTAQWSAKCARASVSTAAVTATGFARARASAGMAQCRTVRATRASVVDGFDRALIPPCTRATPRAAAMSSAAANPAKNARRLDTAAT